MTVVGGTQNGLATMREEEKKSHDQLSWKRTTSGNADLHREKSKYRINEEDGRRIAKGIESPSDDSVLWKTSGCYGESTKEKSKVRNIEDKYEDVALQVKETQTRGRREEKGLQISMGRHVNKVPAVLAQTAAQTDSPALYTVLKDKVRIYKAPIMFYLTAVLISFASVYASFLLVNTIKGPPHVAIPSPPPGFFRKLGNVLASFMHSCRHCPAHR